MNIKAAILRRMPAWQNIALLISLCTAVIFLVDGLGGVVRGAASSAFLPAGLLAALLGWGLAHSRINGWLAAVSLVLLGGVLLWTNTAQLGGPLFELLQTIPPVLISIVIYWRYGDPAPNYEPVQKALEVISNQSGTLWERVYAWVLGVSLNIKFNDVVAYILVWSLVVWLLAAWAGWSLRRKDAFSALAPLLVVLAVVSDYTGRQVVVLWMMVVLVLAVTGLERYSANLRRWQASKLDYAELISTNTLGVLIALIIMLGTLTFLLPSISIKDIAEKWRKPGKDNPVAQSLGLEQTRVPSRFSALTNAGLPRQHLLSGGPELSKDVVFTVRTGELPPIPINGPQMNAASHYWRTRTYDFYTGSGWLTTGVKEQKQTAGETLFTTLPAGYKLLQQNFTLLHEGDQALYWAGMLYRIDQPYEAAWRVPPDFSSPDASLPFNNSDLFGGLQENKTYLAEGYIPTVSIEQLRASRAIYPEAVRLRYLELPERVPERVYELARDLTATASTPYDQARAIEHYLRSTYEYTLEVGAPPPNEEVADYFLFELKKGYCDYYATSMAVLARAVGLPARMVTGYASGTYNQASAEYVVTEANAHSWVEIYFSGIGWIEFEPTASLPEINRPLEKPDNDTENALPELTTRELLRQTFRSLPPLARWSISAIGISILIYIALLILESSILQAIRPAWALRWMYKDLYRIGGRLIGKPHPDTTATEFSSALLPYLRDHTHINLLTQLYLQALFSPTSIPAPQVRAAIKAWRNIRWRLLFTRKITK